MKFVFVSYTYSPDIDSPEKWFERIKIYAGALTCLSASHSVTRIDLIDHTGSCWHDGIQYYFPGYGKRKLYFPGALHRLVKECEPDIVVVSGLHYPLQVIQLRGRLGRRARIIVQNHAEKPFTGFKKQLQRLADRFIDAYFFASLPMGLDWVKRGNLASPAKIHEVMEVSSVFYPMDKDAARSETAVTGHPVFLWVGRLDKNKNPLMMANAFLRFARSASGSAPQASGSAKSAPGPRLYMIYHTRELLAELEQLLDETPGSRELIILVGIQPHDRLLYWYNSADFILSCSWYEGSGAAVCEAMSCGCIPLLTNIFSFAAMTGNGGCGLLYETGNEEALLSALNIAASMNLPAEREKVLERFRSALSFEAIAARFQEVAASL